MQCHNFLKCNVCHHKSVVILENNYGPNTKLIYKYVVCKNKQIIVWNLTVQIQENVFKVETFQLLGLTQNKQFIGWNLTECKFKRMYSKWKLFSCLDWLNLPGLSWYIHSWIAYSLRCLYRLNFWIISIFF